MILPRNMDQAGMTQSDVNAAADDGDTEFDGPERPSDLSIRALAMIKEHALPPSPMVYELFFTYAEGRDDMLNHAIDRLIDRRTPPRLSELEELHQRHFVDALRVQDVHHDLFVGLEDEMSSLLDTVGAYLDTNKGFSGELTTSINKIDKSAKPQTIRATVMKLVDENRKMRLETEEMTERLEQSRGEIKEIRHSLVEAQEKILTDPLTGLGNRRRLDQVLPHEIGRAQARGEPLCIAMADIDHFKRINDTFGHPVGDAVLEAFGGVIRRNVKGRDEAIRFGGEEFVIILPMTSLEQARRLMDTIREELQASHFTVSRSGEALGLITVSLGVTGMGAGDTVDSLIARADANLYRAKSEGRNRVVAA
ncbi:MAG: GGDEF domain-containing protein [Pseudomonadota bacterium]